MRDLAVLSIHLIVTIAWLHEYHRKKRYRGPNCYIVVIGAKIRNSVPCVGNSPHCNSDVRIVAIGYESVDNRQSFVLTK